MSQIKTTEIEGDVSVGRNVTTGGSATVQGNATVKKNLKVEGWLEAENIKGCLKGWFDTSVQLKNMWPRPRNGDWALVSANLSLPATVYKVVGREWRETTTQWDGSLNVDLERVHDLEGDVVVLDSDVETLKRQVGGLEDWKDGDNTSQNPGAERRLSEAELDIAELRNWKDGTEETPGAEERLSEAEESIDDHGQRLDHIEGVHIPRITELEKYRLVKLESDEFKFAIEDSAGNFLLGIDHAGRLVVNSHGEPRLLEGYLPAETEDCDFKYAIVDSDGRLLLGIRHDGTVTAKRFEEDAQPMRGIYREGNELKYEGMEANGAPRVWLDRESLEVKVDYPSGYAGPMLTVDDGMLFAV